LSKGWLGSCCGPGRPEVRGAEADGAETMRRSVAGIKTVVVEVVLLGLVGAGCQAMERNGEPTRLRPARHPYITDAPEPVGFSLVDKLSEDHATPGWRFVRYTYRGQADRQSVLDYYREQMPLNNWTYISRQGLKGCYTLLFEKPNEQCEVSIETDGRDLLGRGSRVQVLIRPLRRSGQMKGEGKSQ